MNRRNALGALGATLAGMAITTFCGCGASTSSNVEEEKVVTQESYEQTKKAIDDGLKNMGKPAK
jgi:hypothetical protein